MLKALEESFVVKAVTEVPVTLGLVACLSAAAWMQVSVGSLEDVDGLIAMGAVSTDHLGPLDGWRVFTSSWLHWDGSHWLGNVLMLLPLGLLVESVVGSRRFAAVFCVATVAGSAASLLVHMPRAGVGISDGVFGLLGMAMAMAFAPAGRLSSTQSGAVRRYLLPLIWIATLQSFRPQVAVAAHGAGLLVGLVAGGSGLVWLGLPRRYEGHLHTFDAWGMVRWTVAAMLCGFADLALTLIALVMCVTVWLELAHDAEPPANLAGASTVLGGLGVGTLGAGFLGVMGLGWGLMPADGREEVAVDLVQVHPDLPAMRDPGPDPTFEVVPRPEDPDAVVDLLLEGVERPGVMAATPCPTVWWKDCARRLFPTVVVRTCDPGNAYRIRELACEGAELPPLHLGLLAKGIGNPMAARARLDEALASAPDDPRAKLLRAEGCTAVLRAAKAVAASDDPYGWRDAGDALAACDAGRSEGLLQRYAAWVAEAADKN